LATSNNSCHDPSLSTASTAPTYRQIDNYLFSELELACITFAAQVTMEENRRAIRKVEQATPDGPAVIHFVDGTSLSVAQVIRAKQPPHLGGISSGDDANRSAVRPDAAASRPGESPMATARGDGPVIAVVGAGQAGIATLINTVVDVAYRTPDGASPTKIVVIDTKDQPKPRGDTPYPLGGRSPPTPPATRPTRASITFWSIHGQHLPFNCPCAAHPLHPPSQITWFLTTSGNPATISFADQIT
jgi:hypothetical protein